MAPAAAILRHDLGVMASSWLVRSWLAASALAVLLLTAAQWSQVPTARLVALGFMPYLIFPWFLPVIMLGVGAVSGAQAESLSDSILSRPITRYEYLLAAWAARVAAVLGVFLAVMVPAVLLIALADRPVLDEEITVYGSVAATCLVGLVLVFLVSLSMLLGVVFRRSLVAVLLLTVLWPLSGLILGTYELEEFSPISLNQAMPTLLREPWPWAKPEKEEEASDFSGVSDFFRVFGQATRETPKPNAGFFDEGDYEDVSLLRVALGYGIPTLLCVGLATALFSVRDL